MAAGSSVVVSFAVRNRSRVRAGASDIGFLLSETRVHSPGALFLGSRTVNALQPGQSFSGQATFDIPVSTTLGAFFVIGTADVFHVVTEANERNNSLSTPLTITP